VRGVDEGVAVHAEVTEAQVVGHDEKKVRAFRCGIPFVRTLGKRGWRHEYWVQQCGSQGTHVNAAIKEKVERVVLNAFSERSFPT
jgi:hypothetical protein